MYDTPEHLPYHKGIILSECLSRSVEILLGMIIEPFER